MRPFPAAKPRTRPPEPLVLDGLTELGSQGPAWREPGHDGAAPARPRAGHGRAGRMLEALGRVVARLSLAAGPLSSPR
jgi:hypothetical protein